MTHSSICSILIHSTLCPCNLLPRARQLAPARVAAHDCKIAIGGAAVDSKPTFDVLALLTAWRRVLQVPSGCAGVPPVPGSCWGPLLQRAWCRGWLIRTSYVFAQPLESAVARRSLTFSFASRRVAPNHARTRRLIVWPLLTPPVPLLPILVATGSRALYARQHPAAATATSAAADSMGAASSSSKLQRSTVSDVKSHLPYCLEETSKWEDGAALVRMDMVQTHSDATRQQRATSGQRLIH
jgi:hypothetical protein